MVKFRSKKFGGFIWSVACGVGLGIFINSYVACKVTVEGVSMSPTYVSGDTLIVNKLSEPERGEVITFSRNGKNYIKRLIASPGDSIVIRDSKVFVNDEELKEDYINESVFEGGLYEGFEYLLKEDEYFVMGDNRNYSLDSRKIGVIYESEIIGTKLIDLR